MHINWWVSSSGTAVGSGAGWRSWYRLLHRVESCGPLDGLEDPENSDRCASAWTWTMLSLWQLYCHIRDVDVLVAERHLLLACPVVLPILPECYPSFFSSYQQGVVTNFEIFRMREKQVPVDVVEMKGKLLCSKKGLRALVLDSSAWARYLSSLPKWSESRSSQTRWHWPGAHGLGWLAAGVLLC